IDTQFIEPMPGGGVFDALGDDDQVPGLRSFDRFLREAPRLRVGRELLDQVLVELESAEWQAEQGWELGYSRADIVDHDAIAGIAYALGSVAQRLDVLD